MSVSSVPMELDDQPVKQDLAEPRVGSYIVGAELGEGGFSTVYLGIHEQTKQRVALKVLKKRLGGAGNQQEKSEELQVRREIAAMSKLQHPNILRLVDVNWNAPTKGLGLGGSVVVVLEFAAGGELFEFLSYTGAFEESIARTYFHQLISAVDYAHSLRVFHRDLKPENLLLDENFVLKLADFGFSNMIDGGPNSSNLMYTECGTPSYMAPEMFHNRGYDPSLVDIWACGVILFIMLAGFPPFQKPNVSDWWFQKLASNRHHLFWQAHSRSCYFSEPTKDFLNKILAPDPMKRMTLAQLKKHEWFAKGQLIPAEQLQQELRRRKQTVNERKMREQQEMARQAAMRAAAAGAGLGQAAARDLPVGNPDVAGALGAKDKEAAEEMRQRGNDAKRKKTARKVQHGNAFGAGSSFFNMVMLQTSATVFRPDELPDPKDYDPFLLGSECYTKFYTTDRPYRVLQRLVDVLEDMDCRYTQNKDEYSVRADVSTLTGEVKIMAQLYKLPQEEGSEEPQKYVVEIRRRSGDAIAYQSLFAVLFREMDSMIYHPPADQEDSSEESSENSASAEGDSESAPGADPIAAFQARFGNLTLDPEDAAAAEAEEAAEQATANGDAASADEAEKSGVE